MRDISSYFQRTSPRINAKKSPCALGTSEKKGFLSANHNSNKDGQPQDISSSDSDSDFVQSCRLKGKVSRILMKRAINTDFDSSGSAKNTSLDVPVRSDRIADCAVDVGNSSPEYQTDDMEISIKENDIATCIEDCMNSSKKFIETVKGESVFGGERSVKKNNFVCIDDCKNTPKNSIDMDQRSISILIEDCINVLRENSSEENQMSKVSNFDIDTIAPKIKSRSNNLFNYFIKDDKKLKTEDKNTDGSPIDCLKMVKVVAQIHSPPHARRKLNDHWITIQNRSPVVKTTRIDNMEQFNFDDITVIRVEPTMSVKNSDNKHSKWKIEKNISACANSTSEIITSSKVQCKENNEQMSATESSRFLKTMDSWKMKVQFAPGANIQVSQKNKFGSQSPVSYSLPRRIIIQKENSGDAQVLNLNTFKKCNSNAAGKLLASKAEEIPKKLAPLFHKKQSSKRSAPIEISEAKKAFLQGGLPNIVLKRIDEHKNSVQDSDFQNYSFPKNNHIQQQTNSFVWHLSNIVDLNLNESEEMAFPIVSNQSTSLLYKGIENNIVKTTENFILEEEIAALKKTKPDINVFDIYTSLKRLHSNSQNIDKVCWTEKYKPCKLKDFIGNTDSVLKLKEWIQSKEFARYKAYDNNDDSDSSSSSEFIDSDDNGSTLQERNVAIVVGPTGCGKTCAVYMLANELGFKVLEVNASSSRNGKILLSELLEATQSHRVKHTSIFEKRMKIEKKRKRLDSSHRKKVMSLILIEDADILFENHDEGFFSALNSLVDRSKRPVIFIANDIKLPHLKKYNNTNNLVLRFSYPSRELINVWLQLIALTEGVKLFDHILMDLFMEAGLDLRKNLLLLQLLICSASCSSKLTGERIFFNCWYTAIAIDRDNYHREIRNLVAPDQLFSPVKEEKSHPSEVTNRISGSPVKCLKLSTDTRSLQIHGMFLDNISLLEKLKSFKNADWFYGDEYSQFLGARFFSSYLEDKSEFSFSQYYSVFRTDSKIKSAHNNTLSHFKSGLNGSYSKYCDYLPAIRNIIRIDESKQIGSLKRSNRYFSYLKAANIYSPAVGTRNVYQP